MMATLTMIGKGSYQSITSLLSQEIQSSGLSCTLVDSVTHQLAGGTVGVYVFEKYYMRTSNRASLTVVIAAQGDAIRVDAIGSGGGQGAVFRFSWGAEENFIGTVERILRPLGFT
jgi:hypothetical protein